MKTKTILLAWFVALVSIPTWAQEKEEKALARSAFESQLLIDNQSVVIPTKNTLEWDIQHRFGTIQNGYDDLFGFYASSNIRLGFTYSVMDRLNVGIGLTKFNHILDVNAKYLILRQTKDKGIPVSMAYYGNMGIDQRDAELFDKGVHRMSYFHQLIIARRFNHKLSLQIAPSISHQNAVDSLMSNDIIGLSLSGRYKFGGSSSFIFDLTQPLTDHDGVVDLKGNYAFGYEVSTSSHAFQIFISNYQNILMQQNLHFNENGWNKEGLLIGFNITRLWNF